MTIFIIANVTGSYHVNVVGKISSLSSYTADYYPKTISSVYIKNDM